MSMADDILEGIFCDECGQYIGDAVGYPRKCSDCAPQKKKKHKNKKHLANGNAQQRAGGKMLFVTVCDNCRQSSCLQGIFMCSKSRDAGTIDIPLESLLTMGLEHESYLLPYAFEKTPNTDFNLTQ